MEYSDFCQLPSRSFGSFDLDFSLLSFVFGVLMGKSYFREQNQIALVAAGVLCTSLGVVN